MLRRSTSSFSRSALATGGLFASTAPLKYRYQEFEMSKTAEYIFYYPREVPNTSYFHHFFLGVWTAFGWGREDIWIEKEDRRYETTWQRIRKYIIWYFPMWYIAPFGLMPGYCYSVFGDYGHKSFLNDKLPLDQMYIEYGFQPTDSEYVRHIHSRDTF